MGPTREPDSSTPQVNPEGLEPPTPRVKAENSTIELRIRQTRYVHRLGCFMITYLSFLSAIIDGGAQGVS